MCSGTKKRPNNTRIRKEMQFITSVKVGRHITHTTKIHRTHSTHSTRTLPNNTHLDEQVVLVLLFDDLHQHLQ